jgi:hypothetical protein
MKTSQFILRIALAIGASVDLAACDSNESAPSENPSRVSAPTTMPSPNSHNPANNNPNYWNNTNDIGNGSFGQPPPP